jgi:diadenylate cyclase
MSEVSDAIIVVVSEETGVISVAMDGMLKRHLAAETLERLLKSELCPEELKQEAWLEKARRLKEKWTKGKEDGKDGE